MKTEAVVASSICDAFDTYNESIQARFSKVTSGSVLFTTDAEGLWETYLDAFENPHDRQDHNCRCCRHFINKFGGLAVVAENGTLESVLWDVDTAPPMYKPVAEKMARAVRKAKITGVFLTSERVWGTPVTGVWTHFSVAPAPDLLFKGSLKTPYQAMAEKKEDYRTVMAALAKFKLPDLEVAVRLLGSDTLYRSEKVLGQAEWLRGLQLMKTNRRNQIWKAVAKAPAGFCHPSASMIGTLLEDIASGKEYNQIAQSFANKMHPLSYQRPKTAPTDATIEQAEKIVEQLGISRSLERRLVRLDVDEIPTVWRPTPERSIERGGVFGHLKERVKLPSMVLPAQEITWRKFSETVLPTAERIEIAAPSIGNYICLTTAVHADAPPILQWDLEEARNPVSWYVWHNGSRAQQFGLSPSALYPVPAICLHPSMWGKAFPQHGEAVILLIEGAQETKKPTVALFPELLKAELHGVRKVIEAYSKSATMQGFGQPHAVGIVHRKGVKWDTKVRVWTSGQAADYILDRWD